MKKAIVIEDEKLASQYLISKLKELAPDIEVETTLTDVAGSIHFFPGVQTPMLSLVMCSWLMAYRFRYLRK